MNDPPHGPAALNLRE